MSVCCRSIFLYPINCPFHFRRLISFSTGCLPARSLSFSEPSTGQNIPFAFIIQQSAQNVNGDQSEGRRCRPEKTDDTAGTLIWIRIDVLCVSCYNTHAKLYFQLRIFHHFQKKKQPCKRGRKSVSQHWLFSFCIQNLSMW